MNDTAIMIDQNSQVRKPKSLIFAKAKENLPTTANRLWYAVLAEINRRPKSDKGTDFIINGKDIAELANLPANVVGQQLQELYKNSSKLASYTIEIVEDDGNSLTASMISSAKYYKNSRSIRVSIDAHLLPYLKDYVGQMSISYSLGTPMKFKCIYTSPLYDLMNYYLGKGEITLSVAEIREYIHIPEGKYTETGSLNNRALYPAVREINEHSNLLIDCVPMKVIEGKKRTIVAYKFIIKEKDGSFLESDDPEELKTMQLIQQLISSPYRLSHEKAFELLDQYGSTSCRVNFEYTKKQKYDNFIAYYRYCLKNQIAEKEIEKAEIRAADFAKYKSIKPLPEQDSLFDESIDTSVPELEPLVPLTESQKIASDELMKKRNPQLYALKQKFYENLNKRKQ